MVVTDIGLILVNYKHHNIGATLLTNIDKYKCYAQAFLYKFSNKVMSLPIRVPEDLGEKYIYTF